MWILGLKGLTPTSHLGQNIYSGKVRWAVFLKPKFIIDLLCLFVFFPDSAALSKAAAKNKKRTEKRRKERRVLEAMEMKDPVGILREQLQEAKNNQVRYNRFLGDCPPTPP